MTAPQHIMVLMFGPRAAMYGCAMETALRIVHRQLPAELARAIPGIMEPFRKTKTLVPTTFSLIIIQGASGLTSPAPLTACVTLATL